MKAGFDEILRNIQAEPREFVSYKKNVYNNTCYNYSVLIASKERYESRTKLLERPLLFSCYFD